MLRTPLTHFRFRSRVQDDGITNILRRKHVKKSKLLKIQKIHPQQSIKCVSCKSFGNKFNSEKAGEAWKRKQCKLFKTMNVTDQLKLFADIIEFIAPTPKVQLQAWLNNDDCRNSFSKSYKILLHSPNGYGRMQICRQCLVHMFAIGREKFRSMTERIWRTRQCGNLVMEHESNHEGYKNKEQEAPRIAKFIRWAVTNKNLTSSYYTKDKDVVYFELKVQKRRLGLDCGRNLLKILKLILITIG